MSYRIITWFTDYTTYHQFCLANVFIYRKTFIYCQVLWPSLKSLEYLVSTINHQHRINHVLIFLAWRLLHSFAIIICLRTVKISLILPRQWNGREHSRSPTRVITFQSSELDTVEPDNNFNNSWFQPVRLDFPPITKTCQLWLSIKETPVSGRQQFLVTSGKILITLNLHQVPSGTTRRFLCKKITLKRMEQAKVLLEIKRHTLELIWKHVVLCRTDNTEQATVSKNK